MQSGCCDRACCGVPLGYAFHDRLEGLLQLSTVGRFKVCVRKPFSFFYSVSFSVTESNLFWMPNIKACR